MSFVRPNRRRHPTALAGTCLLLAVSLAAADSLQQGTSLRFVPENVSFYASSLRLQEQWQAFAQSNAYQRLSELPLVQMAVEKVMSQWESPDDDELAQIKAFIVAPENDNLLKLACDAFRHEIFLFGDSNFGELLATLNHLNQQVSTVQWRMIGRDDVDEDELKQEIIENVVGSLDEIEMPQVAVGLRVSMPDVARSELGRLKPLVMQAVQQLEVLQGHVEELKNDESNLLVLRLDGGMIPWEKAMEEEPDMRKAIEQIRDKVADRTLNIAFGVYQDYIVFVASPAKDVTECFRPNKLLGNSALLARLRKFDSEKVVSVGYVSDAFAKVVSEPDRQMDQLADMAQGVIPLIKLNRELESELNRDVRQIIDDIKKCIPQPGGMLSFSFLTDSGLEGYTENWQENLYLDGSETLDILEHAGGNPMVVVARNYQQRQMFDSAKWLGRLHYYLEQALLKNELDEEEWELYASFRDGLVPILKQYHQITEEHWKKAFTSGQMAFVMDAALDEKPMWHFLMPPSAKPLPMLEFAWVYPLANRYELEQALEKYTETGDNLLAKLKELFKEHEEELQEMLDGPCANAACHAPIRPASTPRRQAIDDGKIRYPLTLQQVGLDPSIAPCMGWNSGVYGVGLSPETLERLLASNPIEGPLAKTKGKRLAGATYVSVDRLIGFFRPWVEYGMNLAQSSSENGAIEELAPQIDTLLEVMQCYQQFYSVTLVGEDSLVTHFRMDFKDLE